MEMGVQGKHGLAGATLPCTEQLVDDQFGEMIGLRRQAFDPES